MITIEILNEQHPSDAEKPLGRRRPASLPGEDLSYNPGYALVGARRAALLEAAHTARLLKARQDGGPANDVQRFVADVKRDILTLAERYVGRAGQLGARRVREA